MALPQPFASPTKSVLKLKKRSPRMSDNVHVTRGEIIMTENRLLWHEV